MKLHIGTQMNNQQEESLEEGEDGESQIVLTYIIKKILN